MPAVSAQQSSRIPVSPATSVEQVSSSTFTSLSSRTSSQELTLGTLLQALILLLNLSIPVL